MSNLKFVWGPGDVVIYKKDPDKASEMAEAASDSAQTEEQHRVAQDLHAHAANRHLEVGNTDRAAEHQKHATAHAIKMRSLKNSGDHN